MNPIVSLGNKLKWKFENVKDLDEKRVYSDKFTFENIDWRIRIRTKTMDNVKYLSIFLRYDCDNKNEKSWVCEADRKFKLTCQSENGNDVSKTTSACYDGNRFSWGLPSFHEWSKVLSDGFIKDDSIIVEIDLSFKYYDFSKNMPNFTDIIIEVEDTKFLFNKGVLSSRSNHFYNLFVTKKSRKRIIKLDNVKAQDFCYLMASCCIFFETVKKKNYDNVIKLAHEFGVPGLHRICEKFLMVNKKLQIVEKLKYAETHNYNELMKKCIKSLETSHQVKLLKKSVEFDNFKESTKLAIMRRLLDFV